jgi:MFS superfamily sulfate permease-like transporter
MNDLFGIIAVAIAILSYAVYIASTLRGKAKPHAISWGVWATLSGFVFFEQLANQAGPGAWVTACAAIGNGVIFLLALWKGEKSIHRLDWLCLALVTLLLIFWQKLTDPTASIGFAVAIVLLGFIPTIRKVKKNPYGESVTAFVLNCAKFGVALLALDAFTIATALYPAAIGVVNLLFALYLLYEQAIHRKKHTKKRRR